MPTWVAQLELASEGPELDAVLGSLRPDHERVRVLVRLRGRPLGFVSLAIPRDSSLLDAVLAAAYEIQNQPPKGASRGVPAATWPTGPDPQASAADATEAAISVVVCTRNRPDTLGRCLAGLAELKYSNFEVLVVDNAPTGSATRDRVHTYAERDGRFRYVCEPRPGLSHARNHGLAAARFGVVAFTDDDVIVDPNWLHGICDGLALDVQAGCVTGLVGPAALDTYAERYFERRARWPSSVDSEVFDLFENRRPGAYPFAAGSIGVGANFAVDRALAIELGGFDPLLGAGSAVGGGEDLDLFVRILYSGRSIVYHPSAVVWHAHRTSQADLGAQLATWGSGLSAYITKQFLDPNLRRHVLRKLGPGLVYLLGRLWQAARDESLSGRAARLSLIELRGLVIGPLLYLAARRKLDQGTSD